MTIEKYFKIAKSKGWSIQKDEEWYTFDIFSPQGHEYILDVGKNTDRSK